MGSILRAFLIISLSLTGCKSPSSDGNIYFTERDLPQKKNLTGIKFKFDNILSPRGIFLKNNFALVWESKYANDKFHVVDIERETYLYSKGIDGLGPGEITMIHSIEDSGDDNKIWAYDFEQRIYSKYDLRNSNKLADEQFRAPSKTHFIVESAWSSDSTLLVTLVDGWEKYQHIDLNGNLLAQFGSWKDNIRGRKLPNGLKEEELDANLVNYVFQGNLIGSAEKEFFIRIGTKVDFIEVINLKSKTSKLILGPCLELPEFTVGYHLGYQMPNFSHPRTIRYTAGYAGKNSFFVLYLGKESNLISEPDKLNRIFEFDYNGKILNHYQLDFPLIGFTVDEKNKRIYGISIDKDPNIVRFQY